MTRRTYPHPTWSVCTGILDDGRVFYAGRYGVTHEAGDDSGEWLLPMWAPSGALALTVRAPEGKDHMAALVAEEGWQ